MGTGMLEREWKRESLPKLGRTWTFWMCCPSRPRMKRMEMRMAARRRANDCKEQLKEGDISFCVHALKIRRLCHGQSILCLVFVGAEWSMFTFCVCRVVCGECTLKSKLK